MNFLVLILQKWKNCCKWNNIFESSCKEDIGSDPREKCYVFCKCKPNMCAKINIFYFQCENESILTKLGIFSNDRIDKEAALKYVNSKSNNDSTLATFLTTSINECLDEIGWQF